MNLKTFDEFHSTDLDEATIAQWAKRAAATGAAIGGGSGLMGIGAVTGAATGGGMLLAIPLATWGAVSLGLSGLISGALFAGGQARKDYSELKKLMKKIEKYQKIPKSEVDQKKVARFEKDLERAAFLTHKLRTSLNSDIDISSSKGLLRSDIKNKDKFIADLMDLEKQLKEVVKQTKRAKTLAAKKK